MARELILETVVKPDSKTMEERLIEVFGCLPLSDRVIRLDDSENAEKKRTGQSPVMRDEPFTRAAGIA